MISSQFFIFTKNIVIRCLFKGMLRWICVKSTTSLCEDHRYHTLLPSHPLYQAFFVLGHFVEPYIREATCFLIIGLPHIGSLFLLGE